jgi:hypothetical protein
MASKAKSPEGAERRKKRRFERSVPVRVGEQKEEGLRAESINISSRGLYCKVRRYVQPFSKLKVALDLPFVSRDHVTVECEGVVVRVEPDAEDSNVQEYRLAIYFLDSEWEGADLVEAFLAEGH